VVTLSGQSVSGEGVGEVEVGDLLRRKTSVVVLVDFDNGILRPDTRQHGSFHAGEGHFSWISCATAYRQRKLCMNRCGCLHGCSTGGKPTTHMS
jgi:hypothetical protein